MVHDVVLVVVGMVLAVTVPKVFAAVAKAVAWVKAKVAPKV